MDNKSNLISESKSSNDSSDSESEASELEPDPEASLLGLGTCYGGFKIRDGSKKQKTHFLNLGETFMRSS
jgi:hypothetical protein